MATPARLSHIAEILFQLLKEASPGMVAEAGGTPEKVLGMVQALRKRTANVANLSRHVERRVWGPTEEARTDGLTMDEIMSGLGLKNHQRALQVVGPVRNPITPTSQVAMDRTYGVRQLLLDIMSNRFEPRNTLASRSYKQARRMARGHMKNLRGDQ